MQCFPQQAVFPGVTASIAPSNPGNTTQGNTHLPLHTAKSFIVALTIYVPITNFVYLGIYEKTNPFQFKINPSESSVGGEKS